MANSHGSYHITVLFLIIIVIITTSDLDDLHLTLS